jgi:hypothetical protein
MKTRSACRCLLCQLELQLKQQLSDTRRQEDYAKVATSNLLLSGFPSAFALTAHLRACRSDGNGCHPADPILLELLHLRQRDATDTLLRDVLLLAFIPVLHSTSRQIARRYVSASPDDTAQHLLLTFLETLNSAALRDRNSHLAFVLSRMVKRSVFDWVERETRSPGNDERDEHLLEPATSTGIPEPFERAVLLRHFLFRCQRDGVLTDADLELLIHIKLQANFGEVNGISAGYSNALRQKIKRLLHKLRAVARTTRSTVRHHNPHERI